MSKETYETYKVHPAQKKGPVTKEDYDLLREVQAIFEYIDEHPKECMGIEVNEKYYGIMSEGYYNKIINKEV